MIVRQASSTLTLVPALPPLVERETAAASERGWDALDWQGTVRLAADRASGLSAPRWQQHVRTGLLERALSLGADHRDGPHAGRPEAGRRLLAHVDALAEAGLSFGGLQSFADEAELDNPGALWTLTLLFGCLGLGGAEEAFESWIATLDETLFSTYRGIVEVAEALTIQPNLQIRGGAGRWLSGPSVALAAIALETMSSEQLSHEALAGLIRRDSPIVHVAIERLLTRSPPEPTRRLPRRPTFRDLAVPSLAYEAARARILARDLDPLRCLRQRDAAALAALGPYGLDVVALAGDGSDQELARAMALSFPTTPGLLDAMGRAGLPSLFPRLLAALEDDELEDFAHAALATALGLEVARPSRAAWEQVIAALPKTEEIGRFRGGELHTPGSVIAEMRRPDLSANDLRIRADELFVKTGKQIPVAWDAVGVSLEGALFELARLVR
jgi:hypothetical protein